MNFLMILIDSRPGLHSQNTCQQLSSSKCLFLVVISNLFQRCLLNIFITEHLRCIDLSKIEWQCQITEAYRFLFGNLKIRLNSPTFPFKADILSWTVSKQTKAKFFHFRLDIKQLFKLLHSFTVNNIELFFVT